MENYQRMKIEPIKPQPQFGIYKYTKLTGYGSKITGKIKDYTLDIYIAQDKGRLRHKLYYLKKAGEWVKSKLIYFSNNKPYKVIKSENTNMARITTNKLYDKR